jgi:hypothetical protein
VKYALLIFHEEKEGEDRSQSDLTPWIEFSRLARAYGKELAGAPLDSMATAKVVAVRGGKSVVTDGPFADTKEQLCGYYLFDCPGREEALKVASMIPMAKAGHIEVRPVVDFSTME